MKKQLDNINIDFLSYRRLGWAPLAGILIVSLVFLIKSKGEMQFNLGVDFKGGTSLILQFAQPISVGDIRQTLGKTGYGTSEIKQFGSHNEILIRLEQGSSDISKLVRDELSAGFPDNPHLLLEVDTVGPRIGHELQKKAINSILIALLGIFIYIGIRFKRIKSSVGAVSALFHDVFFTLCVFYLFQIEISLSVLAALLTIVGYSLNDTIVVFDRIRENHGEARNDAIIIKRLAKFTQIKSEKVAKIYDFFKKQSSQSHPLYIWYKYIVPKTRLRFEKNLEQDRISVSINQTMRRTIFTSVTTFIVVAILFMFGGKILQPFSFALMIGVIVGTYSSIFIASPALLLKTEIKAYPILEVSDGKAKDKKPAIKPAPTVVHEARVNAGIPESEAASSQHAAISTEQSSQAVTQQKKKKKKKKKKRSGRR